MRINHKRWLKVALVLGVMTLLVCYCVGGYNVTEFADDMRGKKIIFLQDVYLHTLTEKNTHESMKGKYKYIIRHRKPYGYEKHKIIASGTIMDVILSYRVRSFGILQESFAGKADYVVYVLKNSERNDILLPSIYLSFINHSIVASGEK